MKEFNLEQAKAGKPVCLKNGFNARIICFDRKHHTYKIVALVGAPDEELIISFTEKGEQLAGKDTNLNLMMKEDEP